MSRMSRTRCSFLVTLFALCATLQGVSQEYTFRYSLGRNNGTGFEPFRNTAQYQFAYTGDTCSAGTGWQLTEHTFDFTADAVWWFYNTTTQKDNPKKIGLGGLYHYLLYEDISSTNDFMAGIHMQIGAFRHIIVDCDLDVQYKKAQIFAIKRHTPWLDNWNPALRFRLIYQCTNKSQLYAEIASYEYFRYMLFFAPSYTFGGFYHWNNGLFLGAELVPRYIDQFTLSSYYDCTEVRAFFGFTF
ncbi:MAG: hypothetical protein K6E51_09375 [Treponema sp.]|nr:hypothetical protein [Treponema sp.]